MARGGEEVERRGEEEVERIGEEVERRGEVERRWRGEEDMICWNTTHTFTNQTQMRSFQPERS